VKTYPNEMFWRFSGVFHSIFEARYAPYRLKLFTGLRSKVRKMPLIFFMFLFTANLAFSAVIQTEVYHTFSFEGDDSHDIVVSVPENWTTFKEEDNEVPYDLKLLNKNGEENCRIFLGQLDLFTSSTQNFLTNALVELKDDLYGKIETSHSQMFTSAELTWCSFQVHPEGGDLFYACILVYSLKHYLIGFALENSKSGEELAEKCSLFLRHISLRTHQK
jgi:hypothetical protein